MAAPKTGKMKALHARTNEQLEADLPDVGGRTAYHPASPPWLGKFPVKGFKGPTAWWEELNAPANPYLAKGLYTYVRPIVNEYNRWWVDPPPAAGESTMGIGGKSTAGQGFHFAKYDKPIPLEQFQDEMYHNNLAIKKIETEFNISKEHPGMKYFPDFYRRAYHTKESFGYKMLELQRSFVPRFNFSYLWPRFFDSPLGEKCQDKTLSSIKVGLYAGLLFTIFEQPERQLRMGTDALKYWVRSSVLPVTYTAVWGSTICLSCQVRGQDDFYNPMIASAAGASVLGALRGQQVFWRALFLGEVAAGCFHLFRSMPTKWGFDSRTMQRAWHERNALYEDRLENIRKNDPNPVKKWW